MKKTYLSLILISIVVFTMSACGETQEQNITIQTEQKSPSSTTLQTEQPESASTEETEVVSETETETENSSVTNAEDMKNAYEAFLHDNAAAVSDEDFGEISAGNEITLPEMFMGEAIKCDYTYMEEFPDKPILAVRIPRTPEYPYPDENNIIFFVLYKDGLHITHIEDTRDRAMGNNILAKDGLYARNEFVSGSMIIGQDAKVLDENGHLLSIYDEIIFSGSEISSHQPYGAIYDQVFPGASSWCAVSETMLGGYREDGEKIYTIYPEGSELSEAEKSFVNACKEIGIELIERQESIKIAEDYAAELGYGVDILALEDNAVEWTELQ